MLDLSVEQLSVSRAKFLFLALVERAVGVVEMPLSSLHRLARALPPPTTHLERVTFLFGSGRCGSTALACMAERADVRRRALVLSEPPVLSDFVSFKRRYSPE